jgi:dTDP-L-rhamnose 4-epimerase
MNDKPPLIFEDGLQQRYFVHIKDIARACRLVLEAPDASDEILNIGSGHAYTIKEIARKMSEVLNKPQIKANITGKYRAGDIRHCYADITKANHLLGYEPEISLKEGMEELINWLASQTAVDYVDRAEAELTKKGLIV